MLTSGARVEVLVGRAGTGKCFTVGALADTWTDALAGGRAGAVFGLAPSQVAAEVLRDEGLTAANSAVWLGAQRRLDAAAPAAPTVRGRAVAAARRRPGGRRRGRA